MRAFQRVSTTKNGTKSKAAKWTIEFQDHSERERRVLGFTDKAASLEAGRKIMRLVSLKLGGMQPEPDLVKWLEICPHAMRSKLAKFGVIDGKRIAATKGIAEHISDYKTALANRGGTEQHRRDTTARIRGVVNECGIKTLSELTATKVAGDLARRRGEGLAVRTTNHYLTALKMFCAWLVQDGRLSANPLIHLKAGNVATDRRKVRRALTTDEARRLIDAATNGPESFGMVGADRGLLYRLGIETGLRANELRSLIRADFDLVSESPSVRVRAASAKNRREQRVPLRVETAAKLQDSLRLVHPGASVFNVPKWRAADMLRKDLETARKAWLKEVAELPDEWQQRHESTFLSPTDGDGGIIDFHSLRHTCASWLAASGVPITTAQKILRHATIELTANTYTHTGADLKAQAVESLPNLDPRHGRHSQAATGTDGRHEVAGEKEARHKARKGGNHGNSRECMRLTDAVERETEIGVDSTKQGKNRFPDTKNESAPSRTRTCDLRIRNPLADAGNGIEGNSLQLSENQIGAPQGAEIGVNPVPAMESGMVEPSEITPESDADLARLADLWPELTPAMRRSLLTLAEGAANLQATNQRPS